MRKLEFYNNSNSEFRFGIIVDISPHLLVIRFSSRRGGDGVNEVIGVAGDRNKRKALTD